MSRFPGGGPNRLGSAVEMARTMPVKAGLPRLEWCHRASAHIDDGYPDRPFPVEFFSVWEGSCPAHRRQLFIVRPPLSVLLHSRSCRRGWAWPRSSHPAMPRHLSTDAVVRDRSSRVGLFRLPTPGTGDNVPGDGHGLRKCMWVVLKPHKDEFSQRPPPSLMKRSAPNHHGNSSSAVSIQLLGERGG